MSKVSVVICTKNSAAEIGKVIKSCLYCSPKEIIVVDAHSRDKTGVVAWLAGADKVIYDKGIGLGNARNTGLREATGEFVIFVGSDNVMPRVPNLFNKLAIEMEMMAWSGIALTTRTHNPKTYVQRGMDLRWRRRIEPGVTGVIGTPFLFPRKLLNSFRFNSRATWSDDTDLCDKLYNAGRSVGYSYLYRCFEIGQGTLKAVKARFRNYGRSDQEYFLNNYEHWGIARCIKSLLHPFAELKTIQKFRDLIYLPFVLYCIFQRYRGYFYAGQKQR